MKVLFLSPFGQSLPLAQRVLEDGHRPFLHIDHPPARRIGDGLVEKPSFRGRVVDGRGRVDRGELKALVGEVEPDLVVVDGVGIGEATDILQSRQLPTFGGGRWADLAERMPDYNLRLLRAAGFHLPPLVTASPLRVSVEVLWDGLETKVAWWSILDRHFMDGGVGPDLGCQGATLRVLPGGSRLYQEVVPHLERLLKQSSFRGVAGVELELGEVAHAIRLTPRMTFDTIQPLFHLVQRKLVNFLYATATSREGKLDTFPGYGLSVRLSIPPYPYAYQYPSRPAFRPAREALKYIWFGDVVAEGEGYAAAGWDGNLGVVTSYGGDVGEARRRCYRTIERLSIPHLQYRTDIGDFARNLPYINEWSHQSQERIGAVKLMERWGWLSPK